MDFQGHSQEFVQGGALTFFPGGGGAAPVGA